jgi:histidinol dehydrogenase
MRIVDFTKMRTRTAAGGASEMKKRTGWYRIIADVRKRGDAAIRKWTKNLTAWTRAGM